MLFSGINFPIEAENSSKKYWENNMAKPHSGNILSDIANGFVDVVKGIGNFFGSIFGAIGKSISSFITSFTQQNSHVRYGFGSKILKSGSIDCSGWTHTATVEAMKAINAKNPGVYDVGKINGILSDGAAMQIQKLQNMGTTVDSKHILDGSAPVGTLIGIRRANPPGWARGRFKDISHIVMVTEKDGQKYISESGGGGVKLTPYDKWLSANRSGTFFAANPFALTNKNASIASTAQPAAPKAPYQAATPAPSQAPSQALSDLTKLAERVTAVPADDLPKWKINLKTPAAPQQAEDTAAPQPSTWRIKLKASA
jgi:hypothetical protein